MILSGKLIHLKREVKEFNGKPTAELLFISLAEVKISDKKMDELKDAFKDSGKKFTPDWILNFNGYVNLKTQFELPCMSIDGGKNSSVEEYIKDHNFPYMGADVKVSINVKDGAVYPNSIAFLTEGKPYDPFAEFDNGDED